MPQNTHWNMNVENTCSHISSHAVRFGTFLLLLSVKKEQLFLINTTEFVGYFYLSDIQNRPMCKCLQNQDSHTYVFCLSNSPDFRIIYISWARKTHVVEPKMNRSNLTNAKIQATRIISTAKKNISMHLNILKVIDTRCQVNEIQWNKKETKRWKMKQMAKNMLINWIRASLVGFFWHRCSFESQHLGIFG